MRPIFALALLLTVASGPVGAQSVITRAEVANVPNAKAAERPIGPNARVAQGPLGPNGSLARDLKLVGGQVHYPSCAAAGAVRATPIRRGDLGFGHHLDRNGDGIACD